MADNHFPRLASAAVKSIMLGCTRGDPGERERRSLIQGTVWVFPTLPSVCLFFSVCFSIPIPPSSPPGSNSALNWSLKGLKADFLYEATLRLCHWAVKVTVMVTVTATFLPPLFSSCQALTALEAKRLPLTPAQVSTLCATAKPRASSRNVFLIFIVHSVCYRCVHCNYCNSLHMCCYEMAAFQAMPSYFFFPFRNPNILFLPMFQLVCHASLFYFKDQSGQQRKSVHKARSACFAQGRTVAFDLGFCGFHLACLFSAFHAHNQVNFHTHTSHRCCSQSSHLHPGEGTHALCKTDMHTCACKQHLVGRFLGYHSFFSSYW